MKKQTIQQLFVRPLLYIALATPGGCTNCKGQGNGSAISLQPTQTPEAEATIRKRIAALRNVGVPPRTAERIARFEFKQTSTIPALWKNPLKPPANKTLEDLTETEKTAISKAAQALRKVEQDLLPSWNRLIQIERISQITGEKYAVEQRNAEEKCNQTEHAAYWAARKYAETVQQFNGSYDLAAQQYTATVHKLKGS